MNQTERGPRIFKRRQSEKIIDDASVSGHKHQNLWVDSSPETREAAEAEERLKGVVKKNTQGLDCCKYVVLS